MYWRSSSCVTMPTVHSSGRSMSSGCLPSSLMPVVRASTHFTWRTGRRRGPGLNVLRLATRLRFIGGGDLIDGHEDDPTIKTHLSFAANDEPVRRGDQGELFPDPLHALPRPDRKLGGRHPVLKFLGAKPRKHFLERDIKRRYQYARLPVPWWNY